jgi:hypothetical protein
MAKISRPVVYSFVGAAVVYAIVVLTQPDAPVTKHRVHVTSLVHAASDATFTDEDLAAHFARYSGGTRNPFLPALLLGKAAASTVHAGPNGWALTGINVLNGVPNALLENVKTNDSVFLKPGDGWQGLRVLSIGDDTVVFVNALGQQTHLSFNVTEKEPGTGPSGAGSPFRLPPGIGPLPPLPVGPNNISPMPPMGGRPGR